DRPPGPETTIALGDSAPGLPAERWPEVPGYTILDEISRGGMGIVFRARQHSLDRDVALKMILHADHASPEDRARLKREATALAQLEHENIVRVYEHGDVQGHPFFAMELLPGAGLDKYLRPEEPLPSRPAARLVATLARALHQAHEAGIIHRD